MDNINNQITEYSKALRLPVFRRDYKELALEAAKDRIDYEEYLLKLLSVNGRPSRRIVKSHR